MIAKDLLYGWGGGNIRLFHAFNAHQPSWVDGMMSFATRVGDYRNFPLFLAAGLLAAWYWQRAFGPERARRMWTHVLRFAIGGVFALLLVASLKFGFQLPRPLAVLGANEVRLLGAPELQYGFPSGHAAFVILFAASWWSLVAWPYRSGLVALVLWVGVSRIWLGQHFPADVLAGYATGLLSAFLADRSVRIRFFEGRH
jgi:membrane-associated phospholipid phosphatase